MTELSHAAQQVYDSYWGEGYFEAEELPSRLAAALRAAADQIVPPKTLRFYLDDYENGVWEAEECARTGLLAIADELKSL